MSTYYLGSEFDIHCGGLDLQFPHHENEVAQSHAAGDKFANYWMHNHWVTMAGEKMSKSLGNVLAIGNMLEIVRPVELRYYLGSAHYRSVLEYSEAALTEAAAGYRRIEDFVNKFDDLVVGDWTQGFEDAMNDDIAVPKALAEIHTTVRAGNKALAEGLQTRPARRLSPCAPWPRCWALIRWMNSGKMGRRQAMRMQRWTSSSKRNWNAVPKPARRRIGQLRTPSATASPPLASPSLTLLTAPPGR